jgi:hypothetical protein
VCYLQQKNLTRQLEHKIMKTQLLKLIAFLLVIFICTQKNAKASEDNKNLFDGTLSLFVYVCDYVPVSGAIVRLTCMDDPSLILQDTTDGGGVTFYSSESRAFFMKIWKEGHNELNDYTVFGGEGYVEGYAYLSRICYKPLGFRVDPKSSTATWKKPRINLLEQDFEGEQFPPSGWSVNDTAGFFHSCADSIQPLPVPPNDGCFAVSHANFGGGSGNNPDLSYLITPSVNLPYQNNQTLSFEYYYRSLYGNISYLLYSIDNGENWDILNILAPFSNWQQIDLDLTYIVGPDGASNVKFLFFNEDGDHQSPLAVDNIQIHSGYAESTGYKLYLDDQLVAELDSMERSYTFENLLFNQEYEAKLVTNYDCQNSNPVYYTWVSNYLPSVREATLEYFTGEADVMLTWKPPLSIYGGDIPAGLVGFMIYRNGVFADTIPYEGQGIDEVIGFHDEELIPGTYNYWIRALYDVSSYGIPGEYRESISPDSLETYVAYGHPIPFFENFDNFETNAWTVTDTNWAIGQDEGTPGTVARFSGLPLIQKDSYLNSYYLNSFGMTEGKLYLSYDVKLNDIVETKTEKIEFQLHVGNNPYTLQYFYNEGSFDWTNTRTNITHLALGKAFQVKIMARCLISTNIDSWLVDNVSVERICQPPTELSISNSHIGNHLHWKLGELWTSASDAPHHYNIYRSENESDFQLIDQVSNNENIINYTDPESNGLEIGSTYCYKVTAVWLSETDECESAFAEAAVNFGGNYQQISDDKACIMFTHEKENTNDDWHIYPNPAKSQLWVSGSKPISELLIYNSLGKKIKAIPISNQTLPFLINTEGLNGIYYLHLINDKGNSVRKVVITE